MASHSIDGCPEGFGATREAFTHCDVHGQRTVTEIRLSDGWRSARCPECEGEQKAAEDARHAAIKARVNEQRRQANLDERLKRADIPPRFAGRSFDDFRPESEDQHRALRIARSYADGFIEAKAGGQCMIFYGTVGTGKTHLACSILNQVARQSAADARYLSFAKAIRSVKQTYAKASALTEQQALDALAAPDLLVLDEVGVQFGSEAEKIIGFEIINTRYEAMKPTIIISNLTFEELRTCLGDRVIDRLRENGGKLVELTGESHRGQVTAPA